MHRIGRPLRTFHLHCYLSQHVCRLQAVDELLRAFRREYLRMVEDPLTRILHALPIVADMRGCTHGLRDARFASTSHLRKRKALAPTT